MTRFAYSVWLGIVRAMLLPAGVLCCLAHFFCAWLSDRFGHAACLCSDIMESVRDARNAK